MIYETETGVGYFEDEHGRVVDRFKLDPGEYEAGPPRSAAVDVQSIGQLPEIDPHYQDTPDLGTDIDRKRAFLDAGAGAIQARDDMEANANIPPEVVAFADETLRMLYLVYVHLAGDANRIQSFEDRFFP